MDCTVILCMAGGFGIGCGPAYAYMMSRLLSFPPKPPFGFCAMSDGSGYANYEMTHGRLYGFENAYCPEGKRMRTWGHDREEGFEYQCFEREVCRETHGGNQQCTIIGAEPARHYDYQIDLTIDPGAAGAYSTGRMIIDFDDPEAFRSGANVRQ